MQFIHLRVLVHVWKTHRSSSPAYFICSKKKKKKKKVKSHKLFQTAVCLHVQCALTHTHIFWMVLAMQHETLCAEHISVGYPRAGASLNTSHKPFTTWRGKLLPLQSRSHRLEHRRMPRHKPLQRSTRTSSRIISVYFPLLHFPLVTSCAEGSSSINQFS